MPLYPSKAAATLPQYGREFPVGYTPRPLDSAEAAKARAIASLDAGDSVEVAIAKTLNGSDEVPVAKELVADLLAERDVLKAVPLDTEAKYLAAITAKAFLLSPATWVARQKAVGELKPVVSEVAKG